MCSNSRVSNRMITARRKSDSWLFSDNKTTVMLNTILKTKTTPLLSNMWQCRRLKRFCWHIHTIKKVRKPYQSGRGRKDTCNILQNVSKWNNFNCRVQYHNFNIPCLETKAVLYCVFPQLITCYNKLIGISASLKKLNKNTQHGKVRRKAVFVFSLKCLSASTFPKVTMS